MALYHKYRPQTFKDVTGQLHIITTVTNQLQTNKTAHAYLFSGPRGVGKTTTARLIAKALNCENRKNGNSEPCETCTSCQDITNGRSIDVIEIDAASHTGVDNVRENIIENARFKPTKSKYKVFIIDEVHMLSTSAFNALLKTLEEPPDHAIFILATTELHKLPDTIISRCQRFQFQKVDYETLKGHLEDIAKKEKITIDTSVLDRIINKSDGCVRDAMSLLDQLMATGEKTITEKTASIVLPTSHVEETLDFVAALIEKNATQSLDILNKAQTNGVRVDQFAHDSLELLRIAMIVKTTGSFNGIATDFSTDAKERITNLTSSIPSHEIISLIDLLLKRKNEIKLSPLPSLPIEMAIIGWCDTSIQVIKPASVQEHKTPTQKPKQTIQNEKKVQPAPPAPVIQTKATKQAKQTQPDITNEEPPDIIESNEPSQPATNATCTLDDIQKKWKDCIAAVENESPSLVFILKMAQVTELNGNTVHISVPYGFHKDKLMDTSGSKQCVEKALTTTLGEPLIITVDVSESDEQKQKQQAQDLAAAFGGVVVG